MNREPMEVIVIGAGTGGLTRPHARGRFAGLSRRHQSARTRVAESVPSAGTLCDLSRNLRAHTRPLQHPDRTHD